MVSPDTHYRPCVTRTLISTPNIESQKHWYHSKEDVTRIMISTLNIPPKWVLISPLNKMRSSACVVIVAISLRGKRYGVRFPVSSLRFQRLVSPASKPRYCCIIAIFKAMSFLKTTNINSNQTNCNKNRDIHSKRQRNSDVSTETMTSIERWFSHKICVNTTLIYLFQAWRHQNTVFWVDISVFATLCLEWNIKRDFF